LIAQAGGPPPPPPAAVVDREDSDHEAFIGLNWTLGGSTTPEIEIGYQDVDVDVKSNGDVSGAGVSISYDLVTKAFDKIRVKGIDGDTHLQGELGIGYSLLGSSWIGGLSAQGNHINFGVDLLKGWDIKFNGGVNTISDYNKP